MKVQELSFPAVFSLELFVIKKLSIILLQVLYHLKLIPCYRIPVHQLKFFVVEQNRPLFICTFELEFNLGEQRQRILIENW